jgi:hypothetical protein
MIWWDAEVGGVTWKEESLHIRIKHLHLKMSDTLQKNDNEVSKQRHALAAYRIPCAGCTDGWLAGMVLAKI